MADQRTWYVVTFNVCNWLLAMLATWAVLHASRAALDSVLPAGPADAVTTAVGIVVFIALPELLLAVALRLAAEQPFRDAALLDRTTQTIELVLAVVAVAMAEFWRHDPWLAPFALAPLLIVQRSLHVPKLQKEVRLDAKTGLFNALHFKEALAGELAPAERLNRPVSILLADLDLLRKVNNTYGHLAGDAVLTGVADVFRTVLRRGDVAARFGGEEFAVLLPDTPLESALALAERLRAAVATRVFVAPASGAAVRATLSIGVAERAAGLTDPERLIHEADLAVYRAKAAGRNRTAAARAA